MKNNDIVLGPMERRVENSANHQQVHHWRYSKSETIPSNRAFGSSLSVEVDAVAYHKHFW